MAQDKGRPDMKKKWRANTRQKKSRKPTVQNGVIPPKLFAKTITRIKPATENRTQMKKQCLNSQEVMKWKKTKRRAKSLQTKNQHSKRGESLAKYSQRQSTKNYLHWKPEPKRQRNVDTIRKSLIVKIQIGNKPPSKK